MAGGGVCAVTHPFPSLVSGSKQRHCVTGMIVKCRRWVEIEAHRVVLVSLQPLLLCDVHRYEGQTITHTCGTAVPTGRMLRVVV